MTESGLESGYARHRLPWHAIDRYFSGASTPEEAEAIRRWAAGDLARAAELDALRELWLASAAPASQRFDVDAAWQEIEPRLNELTLLDRLPATSARTAPPRLRLLGAERKRPAWRRPAALAAALLLAVGLTSVALRPDSASVASAPGEAREYVTRVGQRAEVLLADGSRAWLGVDSRLRIEPGYGDAHRELHLQGEGYFDVAADPRRPFIVHTDGAVAEALGTEFVVRRYHDDARSLVVVVEGTVAVRTDSGGTPRRGVAVTAGQLASVSTAGLITLTPDADVGSYTGWREGSLEFRGTPLGAVARELARWYDVELVVEDSALLTVPVTGTFTDMPAATVITVVCRSLDAKCETDGRQVRIRE